MTRTRSESSSYTTSTASPFFLRFFRTRFLWGWVLKPHLVGLRMASITSSREIDRCRILSRQWRVISTFSYRNTRLLMTLPGRSLRIRSCDAVGWFRLERLPFPLSAIVHSVCRQKYTSNQVRKTCGSTFFYIKYARFLRDSWKALSPNWAPDADCRESKEPPERFELSTYALRMRRSTS